MNALLLWDDARVFLAIARSGTLSGAALALDMGIATVSRRLDRLESALGLPLFSRHQHGYRLTDDGDALLARAFPGVVSEPARKWDPKIYGIGAQILKRLGVGRMRLMSKPLKIPSMTGFSLEVCGYLEAASRQS